MQETSVPAMRAPAPDRDNPLTRSIAGIVGMITLFVLVVACVGSLPWTLGTPKDESSARYNAQNLDAILLPPTWAPHDDEEQARYDTLDGAPIYIFGTDKLGRDVFVRCLAGGGISIGIGLAAAFIAVGIGTLYGALAGYIGGRVDSAMMRIVDILYGLPYILLVVLLAVAGDTLIEEWSLKKLARTEWRQSLASEELERRGVENPNSDDIRELLDSDAAYRALLDDQLDMGRFVSRFKDGPDGEQAADAGKYTSDELYALWVEDRAAGWLVLHGLAADVDAASTMVGSDADAGELRSGYKQLRALHPVPLSDGAQKGLEVIVLLVAIGGVSWLTMARVIRGQVLSLKELPFMEAARAMGVPVHTQFLRHLLPNLVGPIVVYATLTVPQAILQESFLSFLGIGVKPPLPSWGNLAAEGLTELNTVKVRWWLIVTPCVLLGVTLLALNFVGEGLREAFDPKRARK